jgi:MinD-like ATPase involved in chromosome partitioning or flagellar assembly
MAKVIGIMSLKGGVGKTSVVSSLGDALSDSGKKVLLVDANYSAPNLGLHWNIIDPQVTLHHVLSRQANIKDAIHNADGVDVLPSSIFHNMQINPLLLKDKLGQVRKKYDFILLDSAPSINDDALSVIFASNSLIFVTTPDYPTLSSTMKSMKLARQRGAVVDGLILNKVHNKDFEIRIDDIEKAIEAPVLAVIPYDIEVLRSLSKFMPLTKHKPKAEGSTEYKKLAGVFTGQKYKTFSLKNIFRITPKRQDVNRELFYQRVFK